MERISVDADGGDGDGFIERARAGRLRGDGSVADAGVRVADPGLIKNDATLLRAEIGVRLLRLESPIKIDDPGDPALAARNYAADVKPFRIESTPSSESNGHDGKSAIWRASFASAMQHGVKPFIWSGTDAPDAPSRGVSPGNEDTYNPGNASTQIFDVAFLKVDSDQAFTEAQKHGGDKVLEKNPTTPVIYICDWNHNTNELTWHVIYGGSREDAKLTVAVNASTGAFTRVEK